MYRNKKDDCAKQEIALFKKYSQHFGNCILYRPQYLNI